jgi:V/A-type H+/Na+-transporting ATPase subunit D
MWGEFDNNLVSVEEVDLSVKKIAGVKTPVLEGVFFCEGIQRFQHARLVS